MVSSQLLMKLQRSFVTQTEHRPALCSLVTRPTHVSEYFRSLGSSCYRQLPASRLTHFNLCKDQGSCSAAFTGNRRTYGRATTHRSHPDRPSTVELAEKSICWFSGAGTGGHVPPTFRSCWARAPLFQKLLGFAPELCPPPTSKLLPAPLCWL
jgi:hypothetical protein